MQMGTETGGKMSGQQNPNGAGGSTSSGKPGWKASLTTPTIASAWYAREHEGFSRPRYGVYVNNRAAVFMGEAFSLDRLLWRWLAVTMAAI